jgi:pyruvate dehydrogenase E1 component
MRCRGFLIGGTAGRTTLNGEGLQHEDGHSHVLASTVPNCLAYDPAYAYEIATIVREGIRRMYVEGEDVFYYLTVGNENYPQPKMPEEDVEQGILSGLYRFRPAEKPRAKKRAQLIGSGAILNQVIEASNMLAEKYNVHTDVWSATSWKQLHNDATDTIRWNMLHPEDQPRTPYLIDCLGQTDGPIVVASDYMKILPDALGRWLGDRLYSLGTDGFGRSDTRSKLRDHFEVDARHVAFATLYALAQAGALETDVVAKAIEELKIDPERMNPLFA